MQRHLWLGFLGVASLQIGLLMFLVISKELAIRRGTEVVLATAPVDPRDMFRGEYVDLRYQISRLDSSRGVRFRGAFHPGDHVYVSLERRGSTWEATAVSSSPPDGLFIKGRVAGPSTPGRFIVVEYGIESLFVSEGRGLEIERARDVDVRVAIDSSGDAIIKGLIVDGRPFETNS
jgi:uncharacterized membrane-anchored protein